MLRNLMTVLFLFAAHVAFCQAGVPQPAVDAFKLKYPEAQKTTWEKDNEKEWTANFTRDGKEMFATFSPTGEWLESEVLSNLNEIPVEVKNAFAKKYGNPSPLMVVKVETNAKGVLYELSFDNYDILYRPNGTVFSKVKF